jgi:hypothetical protein
MAQDNFYDITTSKLVGDNLPYEERTAENQALLNGLLSGFTRTHNSFLDFKRGADIYSSWLLWFSNTWMYGEKVIYYNTGEVFECVVPTTTTEPTASSDWIKVADSFIGNDEIMKFNGSRLSLEYALNRRFYTLFADPPIQSEIYISNTITNALTFMIGSGSSNSSSIASNTSSEFIGIDNTFAVVDDFTIFVPTAVMASLGTEAEKIIREFADKYVTYGLKYLIQTY